MPRDTPTGAGSLYMRQFANDYPNETAGMILIDPLPAFNGGLPSAQQRLLSPFLMTICLRFLQVCICLSGHLHWSP
jgi:hypothetical protein